MSPTHVLAQTFMPTPRDGIAFSAMPDAPMLPVAATPRRAARIVAVARRIGARRHGWRLATRVRAPMPAECTQ